MAKSKKAEKVCGAEAPGCKTVTVSEYKEILSLVEGHKCLEIEDGRFSPVTLAEGESWNDEDTETRFTLFLDSKDGQTISGSPKMFKAFAQFILENY